MTAPPWDQLHHAYGPATDVPGQLAALRESDPQVRHEALGALSGSIHHQGTRWPASAHALPALVGLVDDLATPDRAAVLHLLRAVAIGDGRDDQLPFAPEVAFRKAAGITAAQADLVARTLFDSDSDGFDDETAALADAAVVWWAARAYEAAARHVEAYRRWLADPDPDVAACAAELVAWFAPTAPTVAALIAVPDGPARPSANLALAHVPAPAGEALARVPGPANEAGAADARLVAMLRSDRDATAVTAAVALAYRAGSGLPDAALTALVEAAERESLPDVPGWDRALRGFVAIALRKVGLA